MGEHDARSAWGALSAVEASAGDEVKTVRSVFEESEQAADSGSLLYRSILECWLALAKDFSEEGMLDAHADRMIGRVEGLLALEAPTKAQFRLGLFLAATLELPL